MNRSKVLNVLKHGAVGAAVVLASACLFNAYAETGRHDGHGGPGEGHGHEMHGGVQHMVDHMLSAAQANDAQRSQIQRIVQAAEADLKAQHQSQFELHDKMMQALTAPTVDAKAVEALRQQEMAGHDAASKRITQALLDVSGVFTAEQRQRVAGEMKKHHEMMAHRMHDHGGAASAASMPHR